MKFDLLRNWSDGVDCNHHFLGTKDDQAMEEESGKVRA